MSRANNFPPTVISKLSQRAGYKCCYLGCGQATIGPSKEKDNTSASNTGTAAHIYSASRGKNTKRTPPDHISDEYIKSFANGIWMCRNHGKYIDDDGRTFTVEQLQEWKKIGEKVAEKMQQFRCNYLEALSELEYADPKISDMLVFAQSKDPTKDKYKTLDLLLYRKIMEMIPYSARWTARQGMFSHRHPKEIRKLLLTYCEYLENNPIDFSFFDSGLQAAKRQLDSSIVILDDYLSMNTFPDDDDYVMSKEWKRTPEGSDHYTSVALNIQKKSIEFIDAFDELHKLCREKFAE